MKSRLIYLDNHATTQVDTRVAKVIMRHMVEEFGNANSADHLLGERSERAIDAARQHLKDLVNAGGYRTLFTSGATESANLAIRGFAAATSGRLGRRVRIALTTVEHPAVGATCGFLERCGLAELVQIPTDAVGQVDMEHAAAVLRGGVELLCVMAANNVIGTIYPIEKLAAIAHEHGARVFVDATQAVGHIPVDARGCGVDALALSGHKMYGPKGVGALLIDPSYPIEPVSFGGDQQYGLRPGTLDSSSIAGLGEACRLRHSELEQDRHRIAGLRDTLQSILHELLPELVVFGDQANRLPGNLSIAVPGIPNKAIIARVRHRLCVASGAACSSGIEQPSPVLRAIGASAELTEGHIRFGVGKFNSQQEVEEAAELTAAAAMHARQVVVS
jgi:cysteine desulfurase